MVAEMIVFGPIATGWVGYITAIIMTAEIGISKDCAYEAMYLFHESSEQAIAACDV